MKLYISKSSADLLWTNNLPIKLEPKVHTLFSDFISQGMGPMGPIITIFYEHSTRMSLRPLLNLLLVT